jgi:hypothetical protein
MVQKGSRRRVISNAVDAGMRRDPPMYEQKEDDLSSSSQFLYQERSSSFHGSCGTPASMISRITASRSTPRSSARAEDSVKIVVT